MSSTSRYRLTHRAQVYGTSNIRVMDISIVPLHLAAHTQSKRYLSCPFRAGAYCYVRSHSDCLCDWRIRLVHVVCTQRVANSLIDIKVPILSEVALISKLSDRS